MKRIEHNIYRRRSIRSLLLKKTFIFNQSILFLLAIGLNSCSDFVEVDPPKNILISETVFNDPATVESALANIYYRLREESLVSGNFGLTTALGIYSDELDFYGFDINYSQLYQHTVTSRNNTILTWWSHSYNLIYSANDIIKGVENSNALTLEEKNEFKGQALFIRAFIHSLLVNIYGDIPYITTTDYLENNVVSRLPEADVYEKIISDLIEAMDLMESIEVVSEERILPSKAVATGLLARMYLYTEQWDLAVAMATDVINIFSLEPDLNDVFLKESSETIWQLKAGDNPRNTQEANQLIIQSIPGQIYALNETLLTAFEPGDLRYINWIGSISNTDNTITLYFAHKYKALFSEMESLEFSILFRLAEQYLIRAEARANLGDLEGALLDVNTIRNRAGLPNAVVSSVSDVLAAIVQERRVELFTEQGHRWFDLKRSGSAGEALGFLKPNWQETDILFPIPETELEINPNLMPQNNGY